VPLTDDEVGALSGRVIVDDVLLDALGAWVDRHYRDRLSPQDLGDPRLAREGMTALDELTQLLAIGSVYDFQRTG
jgi:succinylarginine dihydrolase